MATTLTLPARPAEPLLSADDVAALLGIGRSTFYRLAWFQRRKIHVSPGRVGYERADVELYKSLRATEAA